MTHDDMMQLLGPILSALTLGLAGVVAVVLTGVSGRLKAYLDAKGQAAASQVVMDASARVQTAIASSAGQIALQITSGILDVRDLGAMREVVETEAAQIARKLPDATDVLKPVAGALADAIIGKVGTMLPVTPPVPGVMARAAG